MRQIWSKILILFVAIVTIGGAAFATSSDTFFCGKEKSYLHLTQLPKSFSKYDTNKFPQVWGSYNLIKKKSFAFRHKTPVKKIKVNSKKRTGELVNNARSQAHLLSPRSSKGAIDTDFPVRMTNIENIHTLSLEFPEAVLRFRKESFLSIVALE